MGFKSDMAGRDLTCSQSEWTRAGKFIALQILLVSSFCHPLKDQPTGRVIGMAIEELPGRLSIFGVDSSSVDVQLRLVILLDIKECLMSFDI